MSDLLGQRAVVVGAGIGGLSMAGALANYFEQVEIFERDRLTVSAASRSGTPQDRHPHGLLAGGLQALGDIFPGFESDLERAGAVSVNIAQEIQYERADVGVLPGGNVQVGHVSIEGRLHEAVVVIELRIIDRVLCGADSRSARGR